MNMASDSNSKEGQRFVDVSFTYICLTIRLECAKFENPVYEN